MTTITGTSTTSATSLGAPTSTTGTTTFDSQSFMRLLIAQIQHQDPLQPMDASQMTQQLTQLTSVERLVSIDGQLGSLSVATASVANAQAADLVGREVQADTSHMLLAEGSPASGAFELPRAAAHETVEIRDANGRLVRTMQLDGHAAGAVPFTWDGKDESGSRLPSGSYAISVTATDADGAPIDAATRISGVVSAVTYDNGYPQLTIDGTHVVLGDVRSIGSAPAPTTTTTTSSTQP